MFSGGREMVHWEEMGQSLVYFTLKIGDIAGHFTSNNNHQLFQQACNSAKYEKKVIFLNKNKIKLR